jgi:hypothetical protein
LLSNGSISGFFKFENGFDKKCFVVRQRRKIWTVIPWEDSTLRKRVAKGELAKGAGGAALRYRPRLGRRGEDLKFNREGNMARGNPKKMNKRKDDGSSVAGEAQSPRWYDFREWFNWVQLFAMMLTLSAVIGTSANGFLKERIGQTRKQIYNSQMAIHPLMQHGVPRDLEK